MDFDFWKLGIFQDQGLGWRFAGCEGIRWAYRFLFDVPLNPNTLNAFGGLLLKLVNVLQLRKAKPKVGVSGAHEQCYLQGQGDF